MTASSKRAQYTKQPTDRAKFYERFAWELPDWRQADQYEWIVDAPSTLVRWEFVRRSIGYLLYWARWHESRRAGFSLNVLIDPRRPGNEARDEIDFVDSRWRGFEAIDEDLEPERIRYARQSSAVYLIFDLTRPIEEQMTNARAAIKAAKVRGFLDEDFATIVVPTKIRLPPYPAKTLRAIDAWDSGESAAEIGRHIFGKQGEDASKEWLRQLTRYWRYHLLF